MRVFYLFLLFLITSHCIAQKNVLFIIIDDLKPALEAYGQEKVISPNIYGLAEKSTVFTRAYTQQAVCAPSRVSFLTGMRPDYTKVWDLKTKMRDMNPDILTMPQYFKQNGFITAGLGKVLHGAKNNDPNSWTLPFISDSELDYADGYGQPANFKYQNARSQQVYNEVKDSFEGDPRNDNIWLAINRALKKNNAHPSTEALDIPDDAYVDGALTKKSIELLKDLGSKNDPFMLFVGFRKPHLPFAAPKKYWDLYDRDKIELAVFQEQAANSPKFAYHKSGELRNYSDIVPAMNANGILSEDKQRELIHGYYACVSFIDTQVGILLEYLRDSGLDKNTNIVLVGDHGWHLGDHGLWNKHSNFEQATLTPLMIHQAGQQNNSIVDSPVELLDIFPTLCSLSGLDIPKQLQGRSLAPILEGSERKVKEFAVSQYPRGNRMGYSLRNERYRYTEWHIGTEAKNGEYDPENIVARELYDYDQDPNETINYAVHKDYQNTVDEMQQQLRSFIEKNNKVLK